MHKCIIVLYIILYLYIYIPRRYLIIKRLRGFGGNDDGAPFYDVRLAFIYLCVPIIYMTVCVSVYVGTLKLTLSIIRPLPMLLTATSRYTVRIQ